jgi:hypothetical protein
MNFIPVPRPKKSAHNPDRPVSALLVTQMQHLHEAERNLPLKYRTDIYINAIRTEGEAAEYIREVTEAIHKAHSDADKRRSKRTPKRGLEIAAAAERPARKRRSTVKKKSSKSGRKK